MQVPALGPSNRFLIAERDRRWPRVLTSVLLVSAVVLTVLLVVGWPRLESTSVHYDLLRLRGEVEELEATARTLALELEAERAPATLAERAREHGLEPPLAQTEVRP